MSRIKTEPQRATSRAVAPRSAVPPQANAPVAKKKPLAFDGMSSGRSLALLNAAASKLGATGLSVSSPPGWNPRALGGPDRPAPPGTVKLPDLLGELKQAAAGKVTPSKVAELTASLKVAKEKTAALDEALGAQLTRVGPALTPDQQQKLIAAYKAKHPEYQDVAKAEKALATALTADPAATRRAALADPKAMAEAAQALAGGDANHVVMSLLADKDVVAAMATAIGKANVIEKILTPAVGAEASAKAIADGSLENQKAVFARLNDVLTPLSDVLSETDGKFQQITSLLKGASEARSAKDILKAVGGSLGADSGPLGNLVTAVGFVSGAAMAAEGALTGDAATAWTGLLQSANNVEGLQLGLEFAARAIPQLAKAGKLVEKLAPLISTIASGAEILAAGPVKSDAGRLKLAASVLGLVGGVAMALPGGQGVGFVMNVASAALSWLGDRVQDAETLGERVELLKAAGIPEPLLSRLANADPEQLSALQDIGMTPQQIQELGTKSGGVLDSRRYGGLSPGALSELAARTSIKTSDLISVLTACKTEAELDATIEVLMRCSGDGWVSSRTALIERVERFADGDDKESVPMTGALDALKNLP
jgi:hypothetical protein